MNEFEHLSQMEHNLYAARQMAQDKLADLIANDTPVMVRGRIVNGAVSELSATAIVQVAVADALVWCKLSDIILPEDE